MKTLNSHEIMLVCEWVLIVRLIGIDYMSYKDVESQVLTINATIPPIITTSQM